MIGLGSGFAIQAVGRRIDTPSNARAVAVALAVLVLGMSVAAVASNVLTVPMSMIAAAILGCGYGLALVSGLQEIQRIAARTIWPDSPPCSTRRATSASRCRP